MNIKKNFYSTKQYEKEHGRLSFGKLLESHRIGEEMSQRDFAKLLHISASSLCDLEKGRKIPSPGRASKIAKKLQVSEPLFIEIALQDQLIKEGLKSFKVSVA